MHNILPFSFKKLIIFVSFITDSSVLPSLNSFKIYTLSLDLILNYISHSAPLNYRLISNDHYIIEEMK